MLFKPKIRNIRRNPCLRHAGLGNASFLITTSTGKVLLVNPVLTGIIFKLYRCEGERQIIQKGDRTDPNNPETTIRECSVAEEKVFEASAPMLIHVDEYEGLRQDGRYPHERHFRIR